MKRKETTVINFICSWDLNLTQAYGVILAGGAYYLRGACGLVVIVVSSLDLRFEGSVVRCPVPAIMLVSLDMKLYPTLSLSTQVYKMGTGDITLGVTLRWTSLPSRGE